MRVLEAHLEAALNAGAEPYLQLQYCISGTFTWINAPYPMFSYKLGGLEFNLTTAGTAIYDAYAIRLLRGAYSHKTPHYLESSIYYVNKIIITQKEQVEIQATIFPRGNNYKYSVNGNQTYQTIIDAICTQFGYTATYESPAAAFWDNIFYPAGRTLTLQSPHSFFTLLRQKLFIYAQDNNDNEIYFRKWIDDGLVGTGGYPDLETIVTFDWKKKYSFQQRTLLWRDENSTTHWYPNPVDFPNRPIYNMGYIESTASTPTCSQSWHENEDKRTFHLKYQDGDIIDCSSGDYQVKVYEVFNRKESPSLYTQFVALPKFSTTEGGPLPSTIEAAAPYTPLNVSPFVLNLNSTDNNLQALAEAVDELTCGPAIYAASEKGEAGNPIDDADKFPLVDSTTSTHLVRWFSWANLKARLLAYLATISTTLSALNVGTATGAGTGCIKIKPSSGDVTIKLQRVNNANAALIIYVPNGALSSSNNEWNIGLEPALDALMIGTWDGSTSETLLRVTAAGNVTITTLAGAGNRPVYADANGKLYC